MTHRLKPITITPEQIIAAAQKIVDSLATHGSWEYTEEQALKAVENYLRCKVSDILAEPEWFFDQDHFDLATAASAKPAYVADGATELVMPPAPEWAHDTIDRISAPPAARPELQIEDGGNVLWVKP